jgi:hypothetical protein
MEIAYIAAPVGSGADRAENIARLRRWWPWLVNEYPGYALLCPWLPYVETLDEAEHRERGIGDDLRILVKAATRIVLIGGRVSPGMQLELHVAKANDCVVEDLTHLGAEPPWPQEVAR